MHACNIASVAMPPPRHMHAGGSYRAAIGQTGAVTGKDMMLAKELLCQEMTLHCLSPPGIGRPMNVVSIMQLSVLNLISNHSAAHLHTHCFSSVPTF